MASHSDIGGKPQVANEDVYALLRERFTESIEELSVVSGGEVAQTYTFSASGDGYILRLAPSMGANLEKERFIQKLLASSRVPIAPILHAGRLGELRYAISRRMPGTPLTELPPAEYAATIPALIETLDAIHAVDVSATTGYGIFGDDGVGFFPSWRGSLAALGEDDLESGSAGTGQHLCDTTFLERDIRDAVSARMMTLLDVCPEERYLVHGDYGFGNVLAAHGRITAVLDWVNAQYGDFLYDVAWLDFWPSAERDVRGRFAAQYAERGIAVPNYGERILCYQCAIGLNALRFFAQRQNEESYRWVRQTILVRLS